jgi:hypothetical protein
MGLFAVLSWDSTFLDRRDVLVLAPLPIRPRTIFLAKAAALGAALGLTTAALNSLPGITWGMMHFAPAHSGLLGGVRPGFRYVESSTVSPEITKRVAEALGMANHPVEVCWAEAVGCPPPAGATGRIV